MIKYPEIQSKKGWVGVLTFFYLFIFQWLFLILSIQSHYGLAQLYEGNRHPTDLPTAFQFFFSPSFCIF